MSDISSTPPYTAPVDLALAPRPPRDYGAVNRIGLWTLYVKEVQRFLKVITQTVLAPVITTLLFFAVFALALGGATRHIGDLMFIDFLAPGLIMMATTQNAFANTSSSIMISKVQGNIVDILMPPLSPLEMLVAFTAAGITRGFVVATSVGLAMLPFAGLHMAHPLAALYFVLLGSMILSLIGILAGLWSEKFDHLAFVTNFIITPFAFLSGTFYSVEQLPGFWRLLAHANPFFFMIDGFRYGMTGHADGDIRLGAIGLGLAALALAGLAYALLRRGWRLKA